MLAARSARSGRAFPTGAPLLLAMLGACHVPGVRTAGTCAIGRFADELPPAALDVVVHTVNRHHARITTPDIVAIANDRLADAAVQLRVVDTVVHADLPASYTGQALDPWLVPGVVNVFIFVNVQSDTDKGINEVQGRYVGNGTIVVSGNTGTWDTLAHEVGHMLGLRHVDDSRNVMGPDRIWRTRFTAEQARTMRRRIRATDLAAVRTTDRGATDLAAAQRSDKSGAP